eukprot:COSAG01_NODE_2026_length_8601_cov_74.674430_4_plen_495_part_00
MTPSHHASISESQAKFGLRLRPPVTGIVVLVGTVHACWAAHAPAGHGVRRPALRAQQALASLTGMAADRRPPQQERTLSVESRMAGGSSGAAVAVAKTVSALLLADGVGVGVGAGSQWTPATLARGLSWAGMLQLLRAICARAQPPSPLVAFAHGELSFADTAAKLQFLTSIALATQDASSSGMEAVAKAKDTARAVLREAQRAAEPLVFLQFVGELCAAVQASRAAAPSQQQPVVPPRDYDGGRGGAAVASGVLEAGDTSGSDAFDDSQGSYHSADLSPPAAPSADGTAAAVQLRDVKLVGRDSGAAFSQDQGHNPGAVAASYPRPGSAAAMSKTKSTNAALAITHSLQASSPFAASSLLPPQLLPPQMSGGSRGGGGGDGSGGGGGGGGNGSHAPGSVAPNPSQKPGKSVPAGRRAVSFQSQVACPASAPPPASSSDPSPPPPGAAATGAAAADVARSKSKSGLRRLQKVGRKVRVGVQLGGGARKPGSALT